MSNQSAKEKFLQDCVAWGLGNAERRWEVCQAYDSSWSFEDYEINLLNTEEEWDLMEEMGITYE